MNNVLDIQRELEKLHYPSPLAIAKEIFEFTVGKEEKIKKVLNRISKNEPWEYIQGYTYFYGNKIFVDKNVLIPRIETEELIDLAKKRISNSKKDLQIFDIGTGSGCIAIALAKIFPQHNVFAIEKSPEALKVAKKNIEYNNCKNIDLIKSDLLNFDFKKEKPTIILANLPYLPTKQIQKLDDCVKNFEPISALDGGGKGFEIYERLIKQIREINFEFAIFEIDELIEPYFRKYDVLKDSFNRQRFVIIHPSHLK